MKKPIAFRVCIAILALIMAGAACGDGSGKWQSGKETYDKVCGYCHEKGIGPVIKGQGKAPELVRVMVRSGLRAMPAFRQTEIDDEALAKVIDYIK